MILELLPDTNIFISAENFRNYVIAWYNQKVFAGGLRNKINRRGTK